MTSCFKEYSIRVSTNNLWFDTLVSTKTLDITANCKWTITKNGNADWYSVDLMSGQNDATLTITVNAMNDVDYRSSSFVISSPRGRVCRTVFVSQNKVEVYSMVNKVFGCAFREKWNTDANGQMIEDSYKTYEYDPFDTTAGYQMYFYENGQGMQRDSHTDSVVYYPFTYVYNPINQTLHFEFAVADSIESYNVFVLTASDSLYRFEHQYQPHWFERASMRKIGTIYPSEKAFLQQKATKRKKSEPIFITD